MVQRLALLGVLGLILLFGLLWLEHHSELTLPQPTGSYRVGRVSHAWTNPSTNREVIVWIWYPAAFGPSAVPAAYMPAPWQRALAAHSGILLSTFLSRDPAHVHAHSIQDAPVAPGPQRYPILLMKSGIGALALDYTTVGEDLASHGYVVVGSDTPFSTSVVVFPDGRVIHRTAAGHPPEEAPESDLPRLMNELVINWSSDTHFILDQMERLNASDPSGRFTGHLDTSTVGVVGHSFGGATAAQFCHDDARCKAGIDIDGAPFGSVIQDGLKQPFMIMLSDHSRESDPDGAQIIANLESIYQKLRAGRMWIMIRGAHHFSFSDQPLLKSHIMLKALALAGVMGPLDARRGLMITTTYVRDFFDVYLKGAPVEVLKKPLYPEVRFER